MYLSTERILGKTDLSTPWMAGTSPIKTDALTMGHFPGGQQALTRKLSPWRSPWQIPSSHEALSVRPTHLINGAAHPSICLSRPHRSASPLVYFLYLTPCTMQGGYLVIMFIIYCLFSLSLSDKIEPPQGQGPFLFFSTAVRKAPTSLPWDLGELRWL